MSEWIYELAKGVHYACRAGLCKVLFRRHSSCPSVSIVGISVKIRNSVGLLYDWRHARAVHACASRVFLARVSCTLVISMYSYIAIYAACFHSEDLIKLQVWLLARRLK